MSVVEINLSEASYQVRQALQVAETAMGKGEFGDYFAQPYERAKAVPQRAGMIFTAYRVARARAMADTYGSNAIKSAAVQRLQEMANKAFDGLEGSLTRDIANVRKGLQAPGIASSPEERAAYSAEASRVWERMRSQLTAGVDIGEIVKRADWMAINVLGEEVAAWFSAQFPSSPQMADDITQAARVQIDQRRYEMADGAERVRLDKIRECDKGEYYSRMAIEHARYSLGDGVPVTLPDWHGGTFTAS